MASDFSGVGYEGVGNAIKCRGNKCTGYIIWYSLASEYTGMGYKAVGIAIKC